MNKSDAITQGPITRSIFTLAVPVVLGMFMEFALSITDYFWVSKLGPMAQDAITSSMVVIWTIFASISIISVGVTALVSRFVGAKDFEKVVFYLRQGLAMSVFVSVVFTVVGFWLTPEFLLFMDTGPETLAHAVPYLRIFFVTSILFFLNETGYAIYRASGDTRTPMKIGVVAIIVNMALDPLLIFGWGPIPAMGVAGASLASAIAVLIACVLVFTRMNPTNLGYEVGTLIERSPKLSAMLKIGKIGLPVSSQQFVFVFVYWFLIKIVHQYGETAAAAMGIGNRMESFSYLTCYGFSVAASTMVGQNLGAGKPERAAQAAWGSVGAAVGLTAIISVLFITVPGWIASIFTDDPIVYNIAVDYLIILGISQSAMAIEIVLEGAFGGSGDTVPPMVVAVPGSLIRVPLAYYLCFDLGWGINGVWWTLTITSIAKAVVLAIWFRRGKWKKKEL